MAANRSLAGFLARLPVILLVISRSITRAVLQLAERVALSVWNVLTVLGNLVADLARWLWNTYCKIEFSVVQVLVSLVLSIWNLRLLLGLISIAVALAYFRLWIPLSIYIAVLAVAIVLYFRMSAEDEIRATESQRPLRELLTTVLAWVVRIAIAAASSFLFFIYGSSGASQIWREMISAKGESQHRAPDDAASNSQARSSSKNQSPSIPSPPAQQTSSSTAQQISDGPPASSLVADVAKTAQDSVLQVLAATETESRLTIEDLARQAGRGFDFSTRHVERNRKEARRLNDEAIRAFQGSAGPARAYELQQQAMAADMLDAEVAGNMAIYAFRVGRGDEARALALYALALPRSPEKTGRTADWNTLAAAYAQRGDVLLARHALFVTLAITPDVAKRCYSAVHAVKSTYGDVLKDATESMFARIKEQGLSDAPECALPIQW